MRTDNYQFAQGKQFAIELLMSARSTLSEPTLLGELISNLDSNCANKPVSFARGIQAVISSVRGAA